ncbi:hypothetical protein [Asticcacaulis solisilvae]|uniref:hypothetical protein n=1 Tax=Asticcacaulis solisilvae TaxID=1217274 RepID=UPI003FD87319
MVAIVTGSGQGLVKSSLSVLGSQGEIGTSKLGQNGSDVIVNAANGNLVIQSQDEMLFGVGLDDAIIDTYNSQSTLTANGWQENYQRKVGGLTGTVNTSGSTITHTTADGSAVVYTYDTTSGVYIGNEMGGAYDTLSYNSSTSKWYWQDGKTRTVDTYDNANGGRLIQSTDASNNSLVYTYTGSQLTKITTANGDYTSFVYTGSLLTSIVTSYTNASGLQTETRVRYGYDGLNRLTTVTTDLSPNDNSVSDGKTYVTTYTYINSSNLIGTISESDGTSLAISYDGSGRVASLTQTTASGVTNASYLTYGTGRTMVTDQQGNATTLVYDSNSRLVQLIPPSSSPEPGMLFAYDANGNLTYSGSVGDPNFTSLTTNWSESSDPGVTTTQTTEIDGSADVYRRTTTTTTPPANWVMRLGQQGAALAAVAQGQNIQFSVYTASAHVSAMNLCVLWRDASGAAFAGDVVGTIVPGGTLDANGLSAATFTSGTLMPRAGAAYAELYVYAVADGTGPVSVAIAQPTVITVGGTSGDANFTNITQNWSDLGTSNNTVATTQSTEVDGGINVYRRQTTSTPASGWKMNLGQGTQTLTAVVPDQVVALSAFTASTGASGVSLYASWFTANGTFISSTLISTIGSGGTLGASGLSTANYGYGTVRVPAGAYQVELAVQATADGSGPLNVAIARPSVTAISSINTTPAPSYVYTYDSNGNRVSMTDGLGNRTTYAYTGNQLVSKTEAANSSAPLITRYVYDSASRLLYTISPAGDVTQYLYNTNGTQKSTIRYTGNVYTTAGTPTSATMDSWVSSAGVDKTQTQRTDTTYDARGLVATVTAYGQTDSSGNGVSSTASTTTYVYDQAGLLTSKKLSSSSATEAYVYDGLGRTLSATDYNNNLTQTIYTNTASGLQAAVTLANGTIRTSTYDKAGELISVTDTTSGGGLTATTTYAYDSVGNLIRTTDPTGLSTYYVYDTLGRKVADVAADGAIVTYAYNANGQVVSTTAYATKLTAAQLSLLANESASSAPVRLPGITPATSASDRWSWTVYDAAGRRVEDIDAQGAVTAYKYDAANRLIATTAYATLLSVAGFKTMAPTAIVLPAADAAHDRTTRTFYNNDGQVVATLDAEGYLTEVVYDAGGRKVRTIAHATQTQSSDWASGTLAQLQAEATTSSDDIYHWWVYDGRGLLRAEIDGEGNTTRYDGYTAAGNVGTVTRGQVISTATLIATPPTYAGLPAPSGTLEITSLTYDQYGHVLTKSVTLTGGAVETTTYTYDNTYNLISQATASSSSASGGADGRTSTIKYDGLGRKIAELTGRGSAALAALGANPTQAQIDSIWAGSQISYGYDVAGRLISRTDSDSRRTLFYYDADGRLTYQIDGTGGVTQYGYDTFGEKSDTVSYTAKVALSGLTGGAITPALTASIAAIASATDNRIHVDYNVTGTVADTVDALSATTTYGYDAFGDATSQIDPLSAGITTQTNKTYNRRGLLKTSTADVGGLALLTTYDYDAFGRTRQVTDPQSNVEAWTYFRTGQVKTDTDGLNKATSYTYDSFGHVKTVSDRNGKQTTYSYSLFDRQITVTDQNTIVTTTTKNAYGQTVKIVDGTGAITTWDYDADGNLYKTTDANGNVVTRDYSSADVMTRVVDARGITTSYAYDAAARVYSQTVDSASGGLALTTTWAFDGKGQTVTVTDPANIVTKYDYDADGHKLHQYVDYGTGRLNLTTAWTYDLAGRTVTQTSPAGSVTRYTYDAADRLAYVIDPMGGVTGYNYDNDGRVTRTQQYAVKFTNSGAQTYAQMQAWGAANASGSLNSSTHYDADGRADYTIDPANSVVGYSYDNEGRVLQEVRYPAGTSVPPPTSSPLPTGSEVTRYAYDDGGRKAFVIDAMGAVTGYTYDNDGRITRTQQFAVANGNTGVQTLDQMKTWASANGSGSLNTWTYYDAAGRVSYTIDPDNYITGYTYDNNDRVVQQVRYPTGTSASPLPATPPAGSEVIRYAYDAAGRKAFVIDPAGAVTGYTYDGEGNVTKAVQYAAVNTSTGAQSQAQMQAWLSANSNAIANDGNNRTTTNTYDTAGRLATTTDAAGYVTGYTYDLDDRVVREVHYALGTVATSLPEPPPSTAVVTNIAYDAAGRKAFVIDPAGAVTGYTYDIFGRVTQTVRYATTNAITSVQSLATMNTWASAHASDTGNRTTSAHYDNNGRMDISTDALGYQTKYTYDIDGRVKTKTQYADLTGTSSRVTSYTYDLMGRLTDVADPIATTHNVYDTFGRLSTTTAAYGTSDAATTKYGYDNDGRLTSTTVAYGTSEAVQTSISYYAQGWVYQKTDGRSNSVTYTYDNAGRVLTTVDGTNAVTTNTYNAFGEVTSVKDPNNKTGYFYYDNRGQQTMAVDAMGYVTEKTYDINGKVLSVIRYAGKATVTSVNDPKPTMSFNAQTDNKTSFTYYNDGSLKTSVDGNGNQTAYTYTAFGEQASVQNALGATTYSYYDLRGQLKQQDVPGSTATPGLATLTTKYDYDAFGNRSRMYEAWGTTQQRTTTYIYDAEDHLTQQTGDTVTVTTAMGATSTVTPTQNFTYDKRGNQTSAQDANGNTTYSYYDHQNRKVGQVDALKYLTTWIYDAANNVQYQLAYQTAVTGTITTASQPSPADGLYRQTTYLYDNDNRRTDTQVLGVVNGAWDTTSGAWKAAASTTLTTHTQYDADGNAVMTVDANGNKSYAWYDNIGRKTDEVDAAGYMTSYVLDAEGNVVSQTQYATVLGTTVMSGLTAGGAKPAAPATSGDDRTTTYTYDHNGQRKTEARGGLTYSAVDSTTGALSTTTNGVATVAFEYNALGEVTKKTEATNDITSYIYDKMGRLSQVITADATTAKLVTTTTYDALGNVLTSSANDVQSGTTHTTTYQYDYTQGGRLKTKTDAALTVVNYGYDANGNTTFQSWTRTLSDTTTKVNEATGTVYDAKGQVTSTFKLSKPASAWVVGDTTTDAYYDAYGEVVARGTNTGGALNKAQEFADFDAAGRVWRSNSDGGATKVYGYDANGNVTLQMQSLGVTDLRSVTNLAGAVAASGTASTINLYDGRNELTTVKKPNALTSNGTNVSVSDVTVSPNSINVIQTDGGGSSTSSYTTDIQIQLSSPSITQVPGAGKIHVLINSSGTIGDSNTYSYSFDQDAGSVRLGSTERITYPPSTTTQGYWYTVTVTQTVGSSTVTLLDGQTRYYISGAANAPVTNTTPAGSNLQIQGVDALATTLQVYARQSGSGNYTLVGTTSLYDANGNPISGGFTCNFNQAPFSTATGNWDLVYQATDASGRICEAKSGVLNFASAGATPTIATAFSSRAAFTAAASGAQWQLNTNAAPKAYVDSTQAFTAFGDIQSQTDANGNTTQFYYDVLGDLIQKTAASVTSVSETGAASTVNPTDYYYYDRSGRQVGHKDANGNLTTQTLQAGTGYDGNAALTVKQFNPDTGVVTNAYDAFGNLTDATDALGALTHNTYDGDNRLTSVKHAVRSDGTYLLDTYVYDELNERTRHTNNAQSGAETTDYDLQGRVSKTVTFGSQITSYGYAWTAGTATTRVTAGQTDDGHWTRTTNAWGQVASYVSDYFSKVLSSSDFGAHATSFTYDKAARVTVQQNTTGGGEVDYTYTVAGQVATIVDTSHRDYASDPYSVSQSDTTAAAVVTMKSVYAYDNDGNRVRETYFKTGTTSTFTENAGISYDALNRVTEYKDGKSDIVYTYDANGNRRSVKSSYTIRGGTTSSTDWYKYDSMNRFVLTGGSLSAGVISGGVVIEYDVDGQRHSATYASDGHREVYQYSADGYVTGLTIATMSNGSLGAAVQRVTRTNDLLGRNTDYVENNADGSTLETRHMSYDGDGRVTDETDYTYGTENGTAVTYKSVIHNDYKLLNGSTYTGQDIGVITHSKSDQYKGTTSQPSTETTYSYAWWTSAKTATVTATGQTTGNSVYSYDGDGFLYELQDTGVNRKIFYQTDMAGQVVSRREWYVSAQTGNYTGGAGRDFFYLGEHAIGDVGTDSLSDRIDYAQQLANDKASSTTVTQAWTTFDYTTPAGNLAGNIDINYEAYNAATLDQSTSSFTALGGESLQDVAQNLWGDSSLWYILADANGLYADTTLSAGQTLRIPAKPANVHNNASTFKVYDPADTMGNTKPTQPQPPQRASGCGFVGDVIAMVVSYVVRAVTWMLPPELSAGLADASRQGVEILVGNQKKFNWTEVKAAMTTAGILDGLSLPQTPGDAAGAAQNAAGDWAAVAQGAAASVIQQGVNMAYGLQKKFDWTAVAVSGAGAGAAKLAEDWGQDNIDGGIFNKDGTLTPVGRGLVGTAAFLAQTTTQMILTHDSFGKSAMAQLPEAIGSTIGGMIGDGIKQSQFEEQGGSDTVQKAPSDAKSSDDPETSDPLAGLASTMESVYDPGDRPGDGTPIDHSFDYAGPGAPDGRQLKNGVWVYGEGTQQLKAVNSNGDTILYNVGRGGVTLIADENGAHYYFNGTNTVGRSASAFPDWFLNSESAVRRDETVSLDPEVVVRGTRAPLQTYNISLGAQDGANIETRLPVIPATNSYSSEMVEGDVEPTGLWATVVRDYQEPAIQSLALYYSSAAAWRSAYTAAWTTPNLSTIGHAGVQLARSTVGETAGTVGYLLSAFSGAINVVTKPMARGIDYGFRAIGMPAQRYVYDSWRSGHYEEMSHEEGTNATNNDINLAMVLAMPARGATALTSEPAVAEVPLAADSAVPVQLEAGTAYEADRLSQLGLPKNTKLWRPTQADMDSSAFKVIVGDVKYTSTGKPVGTIFDSTEGGYLEVKGGTDTLESTYQLRLQTYFSYKPPSGFEPGPFTIETARPVNPTFQNWLDRWGVTVKTPSKP